MATRVAIIGAGSVGFTRKLFRDILAVPELRDTHFALTDISERNLDLIAQLCLKDLRANALARHRVDYHGPARSVRRRRLCHQLHEDRRAGRFHPRRGDSA